MIPRPAQRRPRSGAFGRFLASLVALAVIVVGVPALLVACSRAGLDATHPFPGVGTSDEIRGYLDRGLTTSEITPIALRSLLIVAWALWVVMVVSVLGAIVEAFRGHRSGLPQFSMFAGLGRWIAAGLTALTAVAPNFASAASLPSPRPFVISSRIDPAATVATAASAPVRPGFARVQPGESLEMFAQRTLGDGSRWREIWDLNSNQPVGGDGETWTAPWKLSAGWDLLLPADASTAPADASSVMSPGPVTTPSLAQIVASRPSPAPVGGGGERAVDQHRVEIGDTYWSIAEDRLGDEASASDVYRYTTALMEFNAPLLGYQDPAMLHPGDVVAIIPPPPADDDEVSVAQPADRDVSAATPDDGVAVHEVDAGDSYWDIARDTLDNEATPAEVSQLTADLIDLNSPLLGYEDRRMIHPGDIVYLQEPGTAQPPPDPPTSTEEPTVEIAAPAPDLPPTPPPITPPPLVYVPAPSAPPTMAPTQGEPEDDTTAASHAPVLAGITGAVALATGLTARTVWLRRRRATRGASHTRIAASPTEQAVIAAADVPLVRWAGQHLARMLRHIDRHRLSAAPVAVEISDEAGIEVLWDQPQQAPTAPGWTSADGGWAWRLGYDPDTPVPPDELPAAIPALVTIGRRDGRQLLVDLEAFGTLAVTGAADDVDNFVRSIAVELAVGNDLSDAYVTTVSVDTALVGHLDRLITGDVEEALHRLETARRSTNDSLERAGLTDTFTARAGTTTPIEVVVIVAGRTDQQDVALIAGAASVRSGVAAVVATDHPLAGVGHVRLDGDGTARIEPLGVTFVPVALNDATAAELRDTLSRLADLDNDGEPSETDQSHPAHQLFQPDPSPRHEPSTNGDEVVELGFHDADLIDASDHVQSRWLSDPDGIAPLDADDTERTLVDAGTEPLMPGPNGEQMLVRVLGVPSIPQRPDIGRRELILAALLACRGGTLAATAAQDALWGGKPVEAKTVWNFVAKARTALGDFDDGCPVMPSADRTRGTLRLDRRVTTDLAVLVELLERARQSSSSAALGLLRDGLALVDGPPFDAAGYDWAHRDQDVAYASTAIEQAVEALVGLALESELVDVAREGITRGLRGLPGNEQLYRCRMRVEHHIGNHAGIVNAYNELTVYLADLETEPSPMTTALYHELSRRSRP